MRRRRRRPRWPKLLSFIDPPMAKKVATWLLALGGLAGVSQKATVDNAEAVDRSQASASIAIYAAESVDSLRVDYERLKRRVAVLEAAAGGERLAEARQSIIRPSERKPAKPFWRFW